MKTVLFVCTENAGRSQMAEALFNRPAPDDLRAESAGQCPRWAVTLACGASCPYVPTAVEDWDIPDPAGKSLDDVRAIRDQIELRVRDLIEHRTDAIRADPTAHELRLTHLLPDLIERFPELPAEQIRAVADDVFAELADAPCARSDDPGRPQGTRAPVLTGARTRLPTTTRKRRRRWPSR